MAASPGEHAEGVGCELEPPGGSARADGVGAGPVKVLVVDGCGAGSREIVRRLIKALDGEAVEVLAADGRVREMVIGLRREAAAEVRLDFGCVEQMGNAQQGPVRKGKRGKAKRW